MYVAAGSLVAHINRKIASFGLVLLSARRDYRADPAAVAEIETLKDQLVEVVNALEELSDYVEAKLDTCPEADLIAINAVTERLAAAK